MSERCSMLTFPLFDEKRHEKMSHDYRTLTLEVLPGLSGCRALRADENSDVRGIFQFCVRRSPKADL